MIDPAYQRRGVVGIMSSMMQHECNPTCVIHIGSPSKGSSDEDGEEGSDESGEDGSEDGSEEGSEVSSVVSNEEAYTSAKVGTASQ